MNVDFKNAARRHNDRAELLYKKQYWGDADHLYGLSAECVLKAIMIALGAPAKLDGPRKKLYRQHINKLWAEYSSFVSGRNQSRYCVSPQNPFADWDIAQRYVNSKYFDQSFVDPHRRETLGLFKLLQQAAVELETAVK